MIKRFQFKARRYVPNFLVTFILLVAPALLSCQRVSAEFIGVQTISAADLNKALAEQSPPIVIDIREDAAYRRNHIPGAIRLNLESIDGYAVKGNIPRDNRIVVVCSSGWDSQIAAATFMAHGYRNVYSLAGGMNRWPEPGYRLESGSGTAVDKGLLTPPVVAISLLSQLAMAVAAFVVKPAYILMSGLVILLLWRKNSGDLVLIRNAMLVFFIGENACTLNYLVASNKSIRLEFLHGLGMVGMFFLLFWRWGLQATHYSALACC